MTGRRLKVFFLAAMVLAAAGLLCWPLVVRSSSPLICRRKSSDAGSRPNVADPVRHGDYKDGDNGYQRSYGSKDAYKNNYRSGFRQGYEDGYRNARGGLRTAR